MQPSMNLTFVDNSGEKSTVRFPIVDVTTANIETMKAQSFFPIAQSIAKAIADISLCTPIKSQISLDPALYPDTRPESMYAQRELGLLVEMQDVVTSKRSHFTVPGVDWEAIGLPGSDRVDETAAGWTELVTRVELYVQSEDGNAVTVTGGRLVGRNR